MKKILIILFSGVLYYSSYAQSDSSFFTVRLSSFDVSAFSNIAKLHWKTVCYLQYANFEIQRSSNGTNYTTINSFTADRLRCLQPFDFVDSALSNQGNVFYRINVGNIDGTFYHSVVRRINVQGKGFDLVSVYPTIATNAINFSVTNGENETFRAMVVDQRGIIVKEQKHQAPKGLSYYNFRVDNLPSGYYLLQVLNEKGEIKTAKFIKQ
ncbi:MAG: T9SS type A sorting domain-containing protein [Chitinophagaceae bacterium]|nr:T9SS type A sorting domain-containing protein [Chitinophagaceae bacterium]